MSNELALKDDEKNDLVSLFKESNKVMELILAEDGEITPEFDRLLNSIDLKKADKIDGYAWVWEEFDGHIEKWKAKSALFSAIAKRFENRKQRFKDRLKNIMEIFRVTEVLGFDQRFKIQNSPESLLIDEKLLPREWQMEVVTRVPDRERIKAAIKGGLKIPGCEISRGTHLRKYMNMGKH